MTKSKRLCRFRQESFKFCGDRLPSRVPVVCDATQCGLGFFLSLDFAHCLDATVCLSLDFAVCLSSVDT